jgi:hypothetical protein
VQARELRPQELRPQPGSVRIDARTDIASVWQPSAALRHGLDDVWGVANPLTLADYARYWEGLGSRSSRLYDFLNVGYVIARKDVTLDWQKFELAFDGDPDLNVFRNRSVLPRAQVVYQAIVVADQDQAWEAIHTPDLDPARQVVIEGDLTPIPWPPRAADGTTPLRPGEGVGGGGEVPAPSVQWESDGPNRVCLTAELPAPGYLVVSQAWYPGWRARLETGERLPVLRANYAFQAVPLPAGRHVVTLSFSPRLWWAGVIVGLVTLVSMSGAVWVTRLRSSDR